MESNAPTPIIYKRRERFLDEELDDTKDVITSSSTTPFTPTSQSCNILDSISVKDEDTNCIKNIDENMSKTDSEKLREIAAADKQQQQQQNQQPQLQSIESDRKLTNSFLEQQYKNFVTSEQHQQLLKASFNYDILNFNESICKNSVNSKSCTQSSSTSEAIDFEETALLRRQQLNRVAEWVENNSKIEEQEQNLKNLTLGLQDVNANPQTLNGIISGHIKQTLPNGVRLLTSNFKRTPYHHSKQPQQLQPKLSDEPDIAQTNVILNCKEEDLSSSETQHQEKPDIDLAQMEYNVKQFLLKQNEWSIRSSSNFLGSLDDAMTTAESTTSNATVTKN
uniref:Uncharacterized protein n=1 Tax=Megaselia scalaris TaxID=36166 RepID=T1GPG3_MEGSC